MIAVDRRDTLPSLLCKKSGDSQPNSTLRMKKQIGRQYKLEEEYTEPSEGEEADETEQERPHSIY